MLYGNMDFCLPTPLVYKISTKANIQIVNRREGTYTSHLHARTSSMALIWYPCGANGMYQLWTFFWRVSVQDSNSVFGDIGATHADLTEAVQSFVCVIIGIHGRRLTPTIHIRGEGQLGWWFCHQQVRTCWCISWKPLCCNPHENSNPAKTATTGSVFVRLEYEGWNPCTCCLPCTNRTWCTHRCHNMWLCSTGKGLQHTI